MEQSEWRGQQLVQPAAPLAALEILTLTFRKGLQMKTELDSEAASLLKRAAEGSITKNDFYQIFRDWYPRSDSLIKDVIFREIEHYWAHFHFPRSPKNIIDNDRMRLRLLAQALEEEWDVARTEHEIDQY